MKKGLLAISPRGEFHFFKVDFDSIENLDLNEFPENIKKMVGSDDISRECDFNYNERTISIFAFNDGKAGNENKFELPPPIDKTLYFGCIIAIVHIDSNIKTITKEVFNEFYENVFEGFISLGDDDTWSEEEEENTVDKEFIVSDNFIEYEDGAEEKTVSEEEFKYEDEDEDEDEEYIYIEDDEKDPTSDEQESPKTPETPETPETQHIKMKIKITNSE